MEVWDSHLSNEEHVSTCAAQHHGLGPRGFQVFIEEILEKQGRALCTLKSWSLT